MYRHFRDLLSAHEAGKRSCSWTYRPPRALLSPVGFLLLGSLLLGSVAFAVADSPAEGAPAAADAPVLDAESLATQIAALGSEHWEDREIATNALLALGPAIAPALKEHRESPDPEIRSRVIWLLSVLLPPNFQVELVRVAGSPPQPVEWCRVAVPEREPVELDSLAADGIGRGFRITVGGERPPHRLEIEVTTDRGAVELSGSVPLETLTLLEREEELTSEEFLGRRHISRAPGAWIARIERFEGPPPSESWPDVATIERWLTEELDQTLARDDDRAIAEGIAVAESLELFDRIPTSESIPVRARRAAQLARLRGGDQKALLPLYEHLMSHLEGGILLDVAEIDQLARAVLKHGGEDWTIVLPALDLLLDRFSEEPLWRQHQTAGVLRERLGEPAFLEAHGLHILDALLDRAKLDGIHFEDPLIVALYFDLERRIDPEVFSQHFRTDLAIRLGSGRGAGATRVRSMLRLLHTTLRRHPIPTEEWLPPLRRLLATSYSEDVFALLLDRRNAGVLTEDDWRTVWESIANQLSIPDAGGLYRARNSLSKLIQDPALSAEDRRTLWIEQLRAYALEGQNLRSTIDSELRKQFGDLESRPPQHDDDDGWFARGEQWRKHLKELEEEVFALETPEESDALWLTVADVRLHPSGGGVDLIDCRSELVTVGSMPIEIGADLDDRTIRLERYGSPRTEMYRLNPGAMLNVDRPSSRSRMRRYWNHRQWVLSENRINMIASDQSGSVVFETLLFLESVPSGGSDDPADVPVISEDLLPSAEDPAEVAYEKLGKRIVAKFPHATQRFRGEFLRTIGKFRIEAAKEPLGAMFDENPEIELAKALLGLGDLRGRELLLDSVEPGDRRSIEILTTLLAAGVGEAIDPALEWIEKAGQRGSSPYQLLRALDTAFSDPRFSDHLDEERFLEVLVGALDLRALQNAVVPILRTRTGLDFGYYDTHQIKDRQERIAAQEECYDSWRTWWAEREKKKGTAGPR